MSTTLLKIIACAAMLCDHMGARLFEGETQDVLRMIGRIAFPIFAFLIAEGFKKTRNVVLYTLRLLAAGVISEIPFNLFISSNIRYPFSMNVMFTLATALLALIFADMCIKSSKKEVRFLFVLPIISAAYFAEIYGMDYGYAGILLIFMFYLIDSGTPSKKLMILPVLMLFAAREIIESVLLGSYFTPWAKTQLFAIFSFLPLILCNGKKGRGSNSKIKQYSFYLFYPLHMVVIYLFDVFVIK